MAILLLILTWDTVYGFCWIPVTSETLSIFIIPRLCKKKYLLLCRAVEKKGEAGGGGHFVEEKKFSLVKSENIKFLLVKNMWDFSLFCWTRHKLQKGASFFWICCCLSSKITYHSYLQRVCKFLFLIRTLVKTTSNLMCVSL